MYLESLKYLLAVQQTGSIRKASEQLDTSSQNISKIIKQLETELGVLLFERTSQGMQPTPKAQAAFDFAKTTLKNYDALLQYYHSTNSPPTISGSISIAILNYTSFLLNDVLSAFIPRYPHIQVTYKEINPTDATTLASENILLLPQFSAESFHDFDMVVPLKEDKPAVLVSTHSPLGQQKSITLKKFAQYPTVIYSNYGYEGSLYHYLFHDKIDLKHAPLIVNNLRTFRLYIQTGNYIALAPTHDCEASSKDSLTKLTLRGIE